MVVLPNEKENLRLKETQLGKMSKAKLELRKMEAVNH